jgi:predicted PurR-regulated permease PerM
MAIPNQRPNQSEQKQVIPGVVESSTVDGSTAGGAEPAAADSLVAAIERVTRPGDDSSWDLATKRTVLVIMLVGAVYVLYISRSILPMVLIATILSYLLSPIVGVAERAKIPRALSTLMIYLLVIVALVLLPIIFVPALIDQLRALGNFNASSTARAVLVWANETVQSLPAEIVVLGYAVPLSEYVSQIQSNSQQIQFIPSVNDILNYIQNFLSTTTSVMGSTFNIGVSVVGGIFSVFLTVLVTFFVSLYMTIDAPRIRSYIHSLFPPSYRSELADLLRRIGRVWQAFLRGQLILSIVVGAATYLALILVGMPGALIFAILAGLLEVVPNLGPILAMIPAVIVALIQGSDVMRELGINNLGFAAIIVGIYFLIQQLENNILVPRGGVVKKYYSAGGQRIAMRSGGTLSLAAGRPSRRHGAHPQRGDGDGRGALQSFWRHPLHIGDDADELSLHRTAGRGGAGSLLLQRPLVRPGAGALPRSRTASCRPRAMRWITIAMRGAA